MLSDLPRHTMMANKLKIQADAGRIDNDWEVSFIEDIHRRCKQGRELTDKQSSILEQLFDRY